MERLEHLRLDTLRAMARSEGWPIDLSVGGKTLRTKADIAADIRRMMNDDNGISGARDAGKHKDILRAKSKPSGGSNAWALVGSFLLGALSMLGSLITWERARMPS